MAPNRPQVGVNEQVSDLEQGYTSEGSIPLSDFESQPLDRSSSSNSQQRDRHGELRSLATARGRSCWNMLPSPVIKQFNSVKTWIEGPKPPRPYHIRPFFESVQTAPIRYFHTIVSKRIRFWVGLFVFALWVTAFVSIISVVNLPSDIGGYGTPVRLSCTARFWPSSINCGLNGQNCVPFSDHSLAFSCPADCGRVQILNPRTIGVEEINYRSLVIGGAANVSDSGRMVYRGDSFICGAAIHAGAIAEERGGCGALSLLGEKRNYGAVERNGILSVGFDSTFPLSFSFNQEKGVKDDSSQCRDPRWNLLTVTIIFTVIFSIFTTTPAAFFVPIFTIVYFQISLASDPPQLPRL